MHTLAIVEQGTQIHVEGELLALCRGDKILRRVRLADLQQVLLFGRIELTSAAMAALVRRGVDVVFLTRQGYFRARLCGPASSQVTLRLAQFQRALDPDFCLAVSRQIVLGKAAHQRQILLRAQRKLRDPDLADALGQIRLLLEQIPRQDNLDSLRGLEGRCAALYFAHFGKLILVPEMTFQRRSRRPPRDPVNACLSFGYAVLGTVVETEILRTGLDPMVGCFHQPQDGRPSLMLDLLEEFRPMVDALVLRLINRRQLGPADFDFRSGRELEEILAETAGADTGRHPTEEKAEPAAGVFLGDAGRRIFLAELFRRLRERLHYPPRGGSFEVRDIIREQAYQLARVIDGRASMYQAFVPA